MIPEKWEPVFAKDHAPRKCHDPRKKCHDPRKVGAGFRKGSCAAKILRRALISFQTTALYPPSKPPRELALDQAADHSHSALGIVERSEEHTSELQSRLHLVCRLLLEKK